MKLKRKNTQKLLEDNIILMSSMLIYCIIYQKHQRFSGGKKTRAAASHKTILDGSVDIPRKFS